MGATASKEDVVCTFPFLPMMHSGGKTNAFEDTNQTPTTATGDSQDRAKVAVATVVATHKRVSTSQTTLLETASSSDDMSSILTPAGSLPSEDAASLSIDTSSAMEISFNSMLSERLSV